MEGHWLCLIPSPLGSRHLWPIRQRVWCRVGARPPVAVEPLTWLTLHSGVRLAPTTISQLGGDAANAAGKCSRLPVVRVSHCPAVHSGAKRKGTPTQKAHRKPLLWFSKPCLNSWSLMRGVITRRRMTFIARSTRAKTCSPQNCF